MNWSQITCSQRPVSQCCLSWYLIPKPNQHKGGDNISGQCLNQSGWPNILRIKYIVFEKQFQHVPQNDWINLSAGQRKALYKITCGRRTKWGTPQWSRILFKIMISRFRIIRRWMVWGMEVLNDWLRHWPRLVGLTVSNRDAFTLVSTVLTLCHNTFGTDTARFRLVLRFPVVLQGLTPTAWIQICGLSSEPKDDENHCTLN